MSLLPRIIRFAALAGLLLTSPALAENKKVTLSQAFQIQSIPTVFNLSNNYRRHLLQH